MDARHQLHQVIDEQQGRLAAGVPPDRVPALLALVRAIDRLPAGVATGPDLVTGHRQTGLGVLTALRMVLETTGGGRGSGDLERWAGRFLDECRDLDTARLIVRLVGSGEMRLAANAGGGLDAWLTPGGVPASWVERADMDWWARHSGTPSAPTVVSGAALVAGMTWQAPYPADAVICGLPLTACHAALAMLIDQATAASRGGSAPVVLSERALVSAIAGGAGIDPGMARRVVEALTIGGGNVGWHAELPGGPQAPLVRIGPDRIAVSQRGLLAEPLFFLLRELRRRDAEGYHNAARLREDAFRDDLHAVFDDRRFVASPDRIVLRRDDRRNRTDVDAAIFDRKTGTLALFELKSQDPLARTAEELERQQENLRRAGHQVAAMLDWINRHGADEVLSRMDRATAKRFRVQRVLPFVLGRYQAEPGGGQRRGRVAWGTWSQVLRAQDDARGGNPLLSLHTRLLNDDRSGVLPPPEAPPRELRLREVSLVVYPSWTALQARAPKPQ